MANPHAELIRKANQDLFIAADYAQIPEIFTPDYVSHVTGRDMKGGYEGIRKVLEMYRKSFSDIQVAVEILVESSDRIAWQRTFTAIHSNAFQGFPGSGQQIMWRDMLVSAFRDNKIAEEWLVTDLAEKLLLARKK